MSAAGGAGAAGAGGAAGNPYLDDDGEYRPLEMSDAAAASPTYAAARASWRAANAKDRDGWLALWSPDGRIEDPVGPSFLDPAGAGHAGPDGLAEFWAKAVSTPDHIEFRFDRAVLCGTELLCVGTIRTHLGQGADAQVMDAVGAVVYRVDDAGRMLTLRAFWEPDVAMTTLRPAATSSSSDPTEPREA